MNPWTTCISWFRPKKLWLSYWSYNYRLGNFTQHITTAYLNKFYKNPIGLSGTNFIYSDIATEVIGNVPIRLIGIRTKRNDTKHLDFYGVPHNKVETKALCCKKVSEVDLKNLKSNKKNIKLNRFLSESHFLTIFDDFFVGLVWCVKTFWSHIRYISDTNEFKTFE